MKLWIVSCCAFIEHLLPSISTEKILELFRLNWRKVARMLKIPPFVQNRWQQKCSGVQAFTKAQKMEVLVLSNAAIKVFSQSLIMSKEACCWKLFSWSSPAGTKLKAHKADFLWNQAIQRNKILPVVRWNVPQISAEMKLDYGVCVSY